MHLSAWNTFSPILFCFHIIIAMLFQEIFQNIDPCFLDTMLIMKTQPKEIYTKTSLKFKSDFSKNCYNC